MTEQHAEDLYGTPPEGDAPQGEDLVTDPGDSASYAVLNPTPPSAGRTEMEDLLQASILDFLPSDPSRDELVHAIRTATSVLWGAGYRKVIQ